MRVTLIHNPNAGEKKQSGARELRKLIEEAGHEVVYRSSQNTDWCDLLDEPTDLVAVAGGDGTVGRVARHMIGRSTPIAVLSMGTANNIARSLGISDIAIAELVHGWNDAQRIRVDAARSQGPWGRRDFLEGLGVGLFAWTIPQADDSKALAEIEHADEAVNHAIRMLLDRLDSYKPRAITAELDGRDISGEYLVLEAMCLQYVGPNLHLAPRARPGDGLLHVVTVAEPELELFRRYLSSWQCGKTPAVDLPTHRGRHLKIERGSYQVHIDDHVWPDGNEACSASDIEVIASCGTVEFLLPQTMEA
jgi:diacylglycerol kinase family enzyme